VSGHAATLALALTMFASPAVAQTPDAPPPAPSTQPRLPAEPEQNLINLSTTLPSSATAAISA